MGKRRVTRMWRFDYAAPYHRILGKYENDKIEKYVNGQQEKDRKRKERIRLNKEANS